MNYRFKNIGEVNLELKKQLRALKRQSKEISLSINKLGKSKEGVKQSLELESEIMVAVTGKAKLLPNKQHQLVHSFSHIIQFGMCLAPPNRLQ
ncbi:hypothetical protein CMI48_03345 [Candidatus Pacearchaeota archaeon]|nr:hypothetical protein [Candidatus Pacearchaeota archaeon]